MLAGTKTASIKDFHAEGQSAALTYRYEEGEKFVPLTVTGKAYGAEGSIAISRRDGSLAAIPFAAGETVLLAKNSGSVCFRGRDRLSCAGKG